MKFNFEMSVLLLLLLLLLLLTKMKERGRETTKKILRSYRKKLILISKNPRKPSSLKNILQFKSEQRKKTNKNEKKKSFIAVRAMGLDDSYHHRILDENAAMIETPLIGPLNSHIRQHFKTALYPYNVTTASGGAGVTYNIDDEHGNGNGNGISSYEKSRYL